MRLVSIHPREEGQRLDKYLKKLLSAAPDSFIYKMLRKKNITLNGKKAAGSEKLSAGDEIRLFLAEETFEKFSSPAAGPARPALPSYQEGKSPLHILYEDADVLILDKPAGILSQPDASHRPSMGEHVVSYLLSKGELTETDLSTFRPGICNRLDFHTTGILCAGKTLRGLQALSSAFASRSLTKEYLALAAGRLEGEQVLKGYLHKEEKCNKVVVHSAPQDGAVAIETHVKALWSCREASLVQVELLTGKSHQIRAHLASIGHPLLGDSKYGGKEVGALAGRQMLHAWHLTFPEEGMALEALRGKTFESALPEDFERVLDRLKEKYQNGNT